MVLLSILLVFTNLAWTQHFNVEINETGESQLIIFEAAIPGLVPGDEIGVFDAMGITNFNDCSSQYGELLVGAGTWTGEQLEVVAIGSIDNCSLGGVQLPGYVEGNPVVVKIWKEDEGMEYDTSPVFSIGSGHFGDILISVSELELVTPIELVINEFFFRYTLGSTVPDYVELYNAGGSDIDLTGFSLNDEPIESGIIPAGGFFILAGEDPFFDEDGEEYYAGENLPFSAFVDISLSTSSDELILIGTGGAVLDEVNYDDDEGWPTGSANRGYSAELIDAAEDNNDPDNWQSTPETAESWILFDEDGNLLNYGTPGEANTTQDDGELDCAGVEGGTAFYDDCGYCVGGTTGLEPNFAMDCAGVCDGEAFENECGCVGGTTGLEPDFCYGCTDPAAENFDPDATIDDGSCEYGALQIFVSEIQVEPNIVTITMINSEEVAGFQFQVNNLVNISYISGAADEYGFMVSTNADGLVLGFSLMGTTIPPGVHELVLLSFDGFMDLMEPVIITNTIFSSAGGSQLDVEPDTGLDLGQYCGDPEACNYNPEGPTETFGCIWPEGCNDWCPWDPGEPLENDCFGDCGGLAVIDECGECVEGNTGLEFNYAMDCAGVCFGEAVIDDCGVCSGGTTGHEFNSDMDCAGVCFGEAFINECGCVGGTTGLEPDWCLGGPDAPENLTAVGGDGEIVLTWDAVGAARSDVTLWISEVSDTNIEIMMNNTADVYGFQFSITADDVLGAVIGAASGGSATANGFLLSTNEAGLVLGFSLIGAYIPAGEDVLTNVAWTAAGIDGYLDLANPIFSDSSGSGLSVEFGDPVCYGFCGGEPEVTYNVYRDGINIQTGLEATSWTDTGLGFSEYHCYTVTAVENEEESAFSEEACAATFDCAGVPGGDAVIDDCGVCSGGTTGHEFNADMDCFGDCFGSAYENECGCVGGNTGLEPDFCYGCTDPAAVNYDPDATIDDGSCQYDQEVELYFGALDNGIIEIWMNNPGPLAVSGFQFTLTGMDLTGAFGGSAEANGFLVSAMGGTAIGFSLTGSMIPPGDELLTNLYFDSIEYPVCFTEPIIAGPPEYGELESILGDCLEVIPDIIGCMDPEALNYNPDATMDDGSCYYETVYNTEFMGGESSLIVFQDSITGLEYGDEIGIIDLAAITNFGDCSNQIGELVVGNGIYLGGQAEVVAFSSIDYCDLGGYQFPGYVEGNPIVVRIFRHSNMQEYSAEVTYSVGTGLFGALLTAVSELELTPYAQDIYGCTDPDACNYNPDATIDDGSCLFDDCFGECGGSAFIDDCGECVGGSTGMEENWAMDCAGICFGEAVIDDCGECTGGTTGLEFNYAMDCEGVCYGEAVIDDCGVCSGGTTGHEFNSDMDCAGVCFGDAMILGYWEDLDGDGLGGEYIGLICSAFADPTWVINSDDVNDDIYCLSNIIDCALVCDGTAVIDDCGECTGGTTGLEFNFAMDCFGECYGEAFENECGCVGGNTGLEPDYCLGCTDPDAINFDPDSFVDDGSCFYDYFYNLEINETGESQLIVFEESITGLQAEDQIGIFDMSGLTNFGDCNHEYGELLVGTGYWTDSQLDIAAIGSIDNCDMGGMVIPGYVEGNPVTIRVYRFSENMEYIAEAVWTVGDGNFGSLLLSIGELTLAPYTPEVYGCMDEDACNYNPDATMDDGSCLYDDCFGECGGSAFIDDCGECVGGSTGMEENWAMDCAGVCFGEAVIDDCGECTGGTTGLEFNYALDCAGVCFGEAVIDDCGECTGGTTGLEFNWAMDCAGVCFGDAEILPYWADMDGDGLGGEYLGEFCSAFAEPDWVLNGDDLYDDIYCESNIFDCAMVCDGEAVIDDCGECTGGTTGLEFNWAMDCAGVCFGDAEILPYWADMDGDGLGGEYLGEFCSAFAEPDWVLNGDDLYDDIYCESNIFDCAMVCDGEAVIDDCGECTGGTTGLEFNWAMDCAGVCFGDAEILPYWADMDGDGLGGEYLGEFCSAFAEPDWVLNGDDLYDDIYCESNIFDCAMVCDGEAVIDDCGECTGGTTGLEFNWAMDCAGVCFGDAVIDDCGECTGGTTGMEFNWAMDCAGVCFGNAYIDDCGVCDDNPDNDNECFGCTDPMAYNYDEDATIDDGTCIFMPEGFEFAQSTMQAFYFVFYAAIVEEELQYGDWIAVYNESICVGSTPYMGIETTVPAMGYDGQTVTEGYMSSGDMPTFIVYDLSADAFYEGDPYSQMDLAWNNLGIFNVETLLVELDCAGEIGGSAYFDDCGECVGGNTGMEANWAMDCAGVCFGEALIDDCGICSDGTTGHPFNSDMDCFGVCYGEAVIDDCGECVGGETGLEFNYAMDCAGICFGEAVIDDCGECVGGSTGLEFNYAMDCFGECFGEAFINECGCVGGSTGLEPDWCIVYTQTIDMHEGANLISFYIEHDDPSLGVVLEPLSGIATGVIGEGVAAQPHPLFPDQWIGSLMNFQNTDGYWITVTQEAQLTVEGSMVDDDIVYGMNTGANLISYIFDVPQEITDAIDEGYIDYFNGLISEGVAAQPHPVLPGQWIGSLTEFNPGMGYWALISEGFDFMWNSPELVRWLPTEQDDSGQLFTYHQSTRQAFYFVSEVSVPNGTVTDNDWLLAYHNGVLIGARQWQGSWTDIPVMAEDGTELTEGFIQSGQIPEFVLYQYETDEMLSLTGDVQGWQNNTIFNVAGLTVKPEIPSEIALCPAYPNPFNPVTTIAFELPVDQNVTLKIYNLNGREVTTLWNGFAPAGQHSVQWNGDESGGTPAAAGMYLCILSSETGSASQKLILLK